MTEHDDHGGPDEAWTGAQHRLDRLRHDVASGAPARPSGGARSARRRGARRRTTRLLGVATAVAAVAVAVPVGLALTGPGPADQGLQVATQEATPEPTAPVQETADGPVGTVTAAPSADPAPSSAPSTALSTSPGASGPAASAEPAPTGVAELDGPPAEDAAALAAATVVDMAALEGGSQSELGVRGFASPSGNISCGVGSPGTADYEVGCSVVEAGWTVPRPDTCAEDEQDWDPTLLGLYGGASALGRCANDTVLTAGPPTLAYGTAVVLGDVRCTSLESGITCQDTATGAGFRASRTSALVW